jgi:hypothetical protein
VFSCRFREPGAEEADEVQNYGTIPGLPMGSPVSFSAYDLLPGRQETVDVPAALRERLHASANGFLGNSGVGKSGHECVSIVEDAPGRHGKEDLQESEFGSYADLMQKWKQACAQCVKKRWDR